MDDSSYPPRPREGPLNDYWDKPVKDLVLLATPVLDAGQQERHTIFSLLTMALVAEYWNGNKRGNLGEYPWREQQKRPNGDYVGGDYLGHNIACIGVDGRGDVIDFDFNHNDLLNSSVEHAESRLIRRVFSLTQLYDDWATRNPTDPPKSAGYSTLLSNVTVYTSLESCSQCSGIMALGSVKDVVFLQRDPGQSSIGNILRKLSPVGMRYKPPLPLPADLFGFRYFDKLQKDYETFMQGVAKRPFWRRSADDPKPDVSPSITSFLCTDDAYQSFTQARDDFRAFTAENLKYPDYKPVAADNTMAPGVRSNAEALARAHQFLTYAVTSGHRGTPHKL